MTEKFIYDFVMPIRILILLLIPSRLLAVDLSIEIELDSRQIQKLDKHVDSTRFAQVYLDGQCGLNIGNSPLLSYLNYFFNSNINPSCLRANSKQNALPLRTSNLNLGEVLAPLSWHIDGRRIELNLPQDMWYKSTNQYINDFKLFLREIGAANVQPNLGGKLEEFEAIKQAWSQGQVFWDFFEKYDLLLFLEDVLSYPEITNVDHIPSSEGLFVYEGINYIDATYAPAHKRLTMRGSGLKIHLKKLRDSGTLHVEQRYLKFSTESETHTVFEEAINQFFDLTIPSGNNGLSKNIDSKLNLLTNKINLEIKYIKRLARSPQMLKTFLDFQSTHQVAPKLAKQWKNQFFNGDIYNQIKDADRAFFQLGHLRILQTNFLTLILNQVDITSSEWSSILRKLLEGVTEPGEYLVPIVKELKQNLGQLKQGRLESLNSFFAAFEEVANQRLEDYELAETQNYLTTTQCSSNFMPL